MKVLEARSAMISNYEVNQLLLEEKALQKKELKQEATNGSNFAENVLTIQYETLKYLQNTCVESQTQKQIVDLLERLKKYNLTKAEKLQILNNRPKYMVELYILIEECYDRYTDDQVCQMLEDIHQALPRDDDDEEAEEEAAGEDDGAMDVEEDNNEDITDEQDQEAEDQDDLIHEGAGDAVDKEEDE